MKRPSIKRRAVPTYVVQQEKPSLWKKIESFFVLIATFASLYFAYTANNLAKIANAIAQNDSSQQRQIRELQKQTGLFQSELNELKLLNTTALQQTKNANDLLRANVKLLSINEKQRDNMLAQGKERIDHVLSKIRQIRRQATIKAEKSLLELSKEERYQFLQAILPLYEAEISNVFILSDDSLSNYWAVIATQVESCMGVIKEYDIQSMTSDVSGKSRIETYAEKEKFEKYAFNAYLILHETIVSYINKKYRSNRKLILIDNPYPRD